MQSAPIHIVSPHSNLDILSIHNDIQRDTILSSLTAVSQRISGTLNQWTHTRSNRETISPYQRTIIDTAHALLVALSGNQICDFLSCVLTETEQISLSSIKPIFQSVQTYIDDTHNKDRQIAAQLVSPHIKLSSLKEAGYFNQHQAIYKHSRALYKKNNDTLSFEKKKKSGRPSIVKNHRRRWLVLNHCRNHSGQCHERKLKRKSKKLGRDIFAKRLTVSRNRLWSLFRHKHLIKSRSTFYAIINDHREYKKCKKRTDLCDLCEDAKQSKKRLTELINVYNANHDDTVPDIDIFDIEEPGDFNEEILTNIAATLDSDDPNNSNVLSPDEIKLALNKIDDLNLYLHHHREYKKNKADYLKAVGNVHDHQCIISADFKQKIPIGHKKAEQSWVFRKLKLRNDLGIIVQFKDKKLIFDVITNVKNQTSLLSKNILDLVLRHDAVVNEFRCRNITDIDCWYDVGSHFCNKSFLHHHFFTVPNYHHTKTVNHIGCHFHIGKHGKSECDGHFGFVSSAVEEEGYTEHGVQSSADIVKAISNAVEHRDKPTVGITYFPINFDTDGPLADSHQMMPLKTAIPREKALTITQLKAFKHYIWKRDEQDMDIMTEREGLSLPSVRAESLNKVTHVKISRSHLLGSKSYSSRVGWIWRTATPSKISTPIEPPKKKMTELKRQIAARKRIDERHANGETLDELKEDYEEEPEVEPMSEDDNDESMTVSELEGKTNNQLKKLCRDRGLKVGGNKTQLKLRLQNPNDPKNQSTRNKKK